MPTMHTTLLKTSGWEKLSEEDLKSMYESYCYDHSYSHYDELGPRCWCGKIRKWDDLKTNIRVIRDGNKEK
jgi:hypothetical protein